MSSTDSDGDLASLDAAEYTVGWICALPLELQAARAVLDERHAKPKTQSEHDTNNYDLGRIGQHNIAIAILPRYGTNEAAIVASKMQSTFPGLRFVLMVGIGGGVHSATNDIRLGDLVISLPDEQGGGVIQYDFGREGTLEFTRIGSLNRPPSLLMTAVASMRAEFALGKKVQKIVQKTVSKTEGSDALWTYPGAEQDVHFADTYDHIERRPNCKDCIEKAAPGDYLHFDDRDHSYPAIHYGNIGSGNTVMKNAKKRDAISEAENVICFEMEAAGLMNEFPCLVIRGISDYADSHKHKSWQPYAAIVAAAYAKRLLKNVSGQAVQNEKTMKALEHHISSIDDQMKTFTQHKESEKDKADREEHDKILDWLTSLDYTAKYNQYMDICQPGTGQWFLDSDTYTDWKSTTGDALLCHGVPGVGKTILASIIIHDLTELAVRDSSIAIAYVYCNYLEQDDQSAEGLMCGLLKQLSKRSCPLPECVRDLYYTTGSKSRPALGGILATLQSVISTYSKTFFVVDALDECRVPNGTQRIFLDRLFRLVSDCRVNLLATSRTIPQTMDQFEGRKVELRAHSDDIRQYLENNMQGLPFCIRDDASLQTQITTEIAQAVGGIFLLARLYINSFQDKTTPRDVKRALANFQKRKVSNPDKEDFIQVLDEEYDKAMERINPQQPGLEQLAKKTLMWLALSRRSLKAGELLHALATKLDEDTFGKDDIPSVKDVASVCAGLITVNPKTNDVSLIHYTTQEYFTNHKDRWFPHAEDDMAKVSMAYISFAAKHIKQMEVLGNMAVDTEAHTPTRWDFLGYARHNWGHHARDAANVSHEVISFLDVAENFKEAGKALRVLYRLTGPKEPLSKLAGSGLGVYEVVPFGSKHQVRNTTRGPYHSHPQPGSSQPGQKRPQEDHQDGHKAKKTFGIQDGFYPQDPTDESSGGGRQPSKGSSSIFSDDQMVPELKFMCPFYKFDPVQAARCKLFTLTSITRILQHIKRKHLLGRQLDNCYCACCRIDFPSETLLHQHLRSGTFVLATIADTAMIRPDEFDRVKEILRPNLTQSDKWFKLWEMLFDAPLPSSPYDNDEVVNIRIENIDRRETEARLSEALYSSLKRHGVDAGQAELICLDFLGNITNVPVSSL
ncbi:hypothetical protein ACHAPJ_013405 [Fusarium lateritium]